MKKFILMVVMVLFFVPSMGYSDDCWDVSNLNGVSAALKDDYRYIKDGSSVDPFFIILDDKNPRLSIMGKDYPLRKVGEDIYVSIENTGSFVIVNSYMIDRENKKVVYVKNRKAIVDDLFGVLQGASLFVGDCIPCWERVMK